MKPLAKNACAALLAISIVGCAKVVVRSDADPNTDLSEIQTYYVRKSPDDERGIEKVIVDKLNEFGFSASSGVDAIPSSPVNAIVTYSSSWKWDITMYLQELDVKLLDPETDFAFASAYSYRTSFVRKSPEEVVDEVFRDLFSEVAGIPPKTEPE